MKTEEKNIAAFFVGLFLVAALLLPGASFAASTGYPVIPGYAPPPGGGLNAVTGGYLKNSVGQGQYLFDQAAARYGGNASLRVAATTVSVPVKAALSANAASLVRGAIMLNPTRILGTAAATVLATYGLTLVADQLMKGTPEPNALLSSSHDRVNATPGCYGVTGPWYLNGNTVMHSVVYQGEVHPFDPANGPVYIANAFQNVQCLATGNYHTYNLAYQVIAPWVNQPVPATPEDLVVALSDSSPLPEPIAAELPEVAYMPDGAPVDAPFYDFVPFHVDIGAPYMKPDGSTYQPRAVISPNGNNVTYQTYDQPLTDVNGDPVANPQPVETTLSGSEDPCINSPDRLACLDAGGGDDTKMDRETVSLDYTPQASRISGGCPAPIPVLGHSLSFQPVCDAMTMIRPLILALASVMALYILAGTVRD